jgi:hypothetical protein
MGASAFTPGPWEAREGSLHRKPWLIDAPGRRFIATTDGMPDEESEANARLIAASPELVSKGFNYMQSVKALFAIDPETKACFAEGSPTKSEETYRRFVAFNDATKEFSAALAKVLGEKEAA